jgi:hypothetical protein
MVTRDGEGPRHRTHGRTESLEALFPQSSYDGTTLCNPGMVGQHGKFKILPRAFHALRPAEGNPSPINLSNGAGLAIHRRLEILKRPLKYILEIKFRPKRKVFETVVEGDEPGGDALPPATATRLLIGRRMERKENDWPK